MVEPTARYGCVPFVPSDPSPRILVTGGAGFVGSHLVERLIRPPWSGTLKVSGHARTRPQPQPQPEPHPEPYPTRS